VRCQTSMLWRQLRFSRCSAAVCSRCLSAASAVHRRRVLSLDALPGFYAGFNCASRVAVLLCVQPLSTIGVCCSPSPCASSLDAPPGFYACWRQPHASRGAVLCVVCGRCLYPRRQLFSVAVCYRRASTLVSTALLALQGCRVQLLSILGVGCSPSPCVPSLDALPEASTRVSIALSHCSAALCAATVYYRRLLFSVAVCVLARCAARLLCCGVNCASRVAVLPCAVAVYPRRQLFSVAVCSRSMRRRASMMVSTALLALQCCRVQSRSIRGVGCSPSPCVPSLDALPGFYAAWYQLRFSRCSAALCAATV
jgi:hypothetical protein